MPNDYDLSAAFAAVERELISSMMRNLSRHRAEETKEGIQWGAWQIEQLDALERYRRDNQKRFIPCFGRLNGDLEKLLKAAHARGGMDQEEEILEAIRQGASVRKPSKGLSATFFRTNERKLDALIKATTDDIQKAETAVLRAANDQYRKIIYNAQVYANTGAGTYEKAVDMAVKDFLSRGIQCVVYKNGARHTLTDYADMAIRTASKRAYLQGEGAKRQEWGVTTVILNKRGNPCPLCRPFCGKVFIDDVWSGGSAADGDYPLLSEAIEQGLYHPRCRDSHTTYFPELEEEAPLTKAEERRQEAEYEAQQKENNARRQGEKYDRMAEYSLDPENRRRYQARAGEWEKEKLILSKSNRDKPVSISFSKKKQQSAPEWNKAIGPEIWPTKQRKAMWSAEWGTTGKRHEEARLYDAAGKRLFHKKGGAQEVQFTTAEIKQMRGGVLTHNHPGLDYGCFSPNDINMLRYGKLSEMRCVTPKGVFRIQHPGKWSKEINSLEKIESAYYDISNNTDGRFFERARLGEISFIDAENMAQEATVRELCNRFGIPFEFESWDSIREAIK